MKYKQLERDGFSPLITALCMFIWMALGVIAVTTGLYFLICLGGKL